MPFEPEFMKDLPAFHRALAEVEDLAGWAAFKARWFADQPWPKRTAAQLAALGEPGAKVVLAGRTFTRVPLPDDVTPAARWELFAALSRAFEVLFPAERDAPGAGVRHQCPACEMWTDEPGGPDCPACGRPLLVVRTGPPRR